MFYSHTFLARKGPLGTVWCAAHLQHKLKKSHYASTDIPSTVERIMCPEVPIALRMSGHLLLGVVRIYSKKVDYLHHDCNVLWVSLRNAFRPVDVNLPENASHAQFNAVTLPETYELDALDIDDVLSLNDGGQDNHLKSQGEITLQGCPIDQIPPRRELYVRITFDEITPEVSHSEASPQRNIEPMIDVVPQVPSPNSLSIRDPGPSGQDEERHGRFEEGSSLPDIPDIEVEVMRDFHGSDVHLANQIPLFGDAIIAPEPNISPQNNPTEKETDRFPVEHSSHPHMLSLQSSQYNEPSPPPSGAPVVSDSFVNVTPGDLALRSTPSPVKPRSRKRKRKQLFDDSLVLTNEFLKNALDDCSDLIKKKKKLPCSALDMWRFRNNKKKEQIFSEPLIYGLCENLQNLSSRDLISLNPNLFLSGEAQPEPRPTESPAPVCNVAEEFERLRCSDHDPGHNYMPEIMPSSQQLSPSHSREYATSSYVGSPRSVSELRFTVDTEQDHGMFTTSRLEDETPTVNFEERDDNLSTALSDIHELRSSEEHDELSFLEQDNNSPLDSQEAPERDTMSVRTRAVAQYLKNHSPLSKYSDGLPDDLSLNSILEGRSRKLSARMFFETLVLKSYGLIDLQQDEPYGKITLKLTNGQNMRVISNLLGL